MAYLRDSGQYFEAGGVNSLTHILSDEIQLTNEIDDIIVLNIAIDAGRTMTAMAGFTEIRNVSSGAVRHIVSWRRATAANETIPDAIISTSDTLSCEAIVILGCPTASTPIGNSASNTGNSAAPTWNTITPSAINSAILYFGAMDQDTMLNVGSKPTLLASDAITVTSITGYEFSSAITATGTATGSASAGDGWQTLTLEILDNITVPRIPTFFEKSPGAVISSSDYTGDIDFRALFMTEGDTLEGVAQLVYTFDGATDVEPASTEIDNGTAGVTSTDNKFVDATKDWSDVDYSGCTLEIKSGSDIGTYTIASHTSTKLTLDTALTASETALTYDIDVLNAITKTVVAAAHRRTFRLTGATVPTGLTSGNFYYVHRVNSTYIVLVPAGLGELHSDTLAITKIVDITADGSGTCTLTECGIAAYAIGIDNDYDKLAKNHHIAKNYVGSSIEFTTPIDLTDTIVGIGIKATAKGVLNYQMTFIDSTGAWKSWNVGDSLVVESVFTQKLVDVDNNTLFDNSAGTFDITDVKHMALLYKPTADTARPIILMNPFYLANPLIILGGDTVSVVTVDSIYVALNNIISGTSANPSAIQYLFLHSLIFGNGSDDLNFQDSEKSIAFPPLADGVTSFDAYLVSLGVSHELQATDTMKLQNSQIGAELAWSYDVDAASSSSADVVYDGTTLVRGTVTLRSGETRNAMLFVGGDGITHNDATITNSSFVNVQRAAGYLVLSTTHNISDCVFKTDVPADYAIEIDAAGTYNLTGITYTGFTTDINVTASSGTVTINILGGGDTPTYTTAGATVVINNAVGVTIHVTDSADTDIQNARVEVSATETVGSVTSGDVLLSGLTSALGIVEDTAFNFEGDLGIKVKVRQGSVSPFKIPSTTTGTITSGGFSSVVALQSDE